MDLFADFIQPMTSWLYLHPHWALLFTFLISFSESLAVVGSIIPGSVTMTAIGILAGTGVMRVDLTLTAASLGAIAGDSASYALGFIYRDKLTTLWPFSRYPHWLLYGKNYFEKHGGKSVLIGRFFGPLRSLIPVIAGMMHMSQWRFLVANVLSGIGWSLTHILPGVLIGTASSELSTESATKLFMIILIALFGVWLLSVAIKWVFIRLNLLMRLNLHRFLAWSKKHPRASYFFSFITPKDEIYYYQTTALTLLIALSLISLFTLVTLKGTSSAFIDLNKPIYLFLQSIRIPLFDGFFVISSQFLSRFTLSMLFISLISWCLLHRKKRAIVFLLSMAVTSLLLNYLMLGQALDLTLASALFTFLIGILIRIQIPLFSTMGCYILITLLFLKGMACVYLGEQWFTDVIISYFLGLNIGLIHWLFFRKSSSLTQHPSVITMLILSLIFLLGATISIYINYNDTLKKYAVVFNHEVLDKNTWWNQHEPILPLYRMNRVGSRTNLLNIQYDGNIANLQNALENHGWITYSDTLLAKLLKRTSGKAPYKTFPLLPPLFENKRPQLVMIYQNMQSNSHIILLLWRSNYYLSNESNPLWIGSLYPEGKQLIESIHGASSFALTNPFLYFLPALDDFDKKSVNIPASQERPIPYRIEPTLLLIKKRGLHKRRTPNSRMEPVSVRPFSPTMVEPNP